MVIFHSYVSLPEGNHWNYQPTPCQQTVLSSGQALSNHLWVSPPRMVPWYAPRQGSRGWELNAESGAVEKQIIHNHWDFWVSPHSDQAIWRESSLKQKLWSVQVWPTNNWTKQHLCNRPQILMTRGILTDFSILELVGRPHLILHLNLRLTLKLLAPGGYFTILHMRQKRRLLMKIKSTASEKPPQKIQCLDPFLTHFFNCQCIHKKKQKVGRSLTIQMATKNMSCIKLSTGLSQVFIQLHVQ